MSVEIPCRNSGNKYSGSADLEFLFSNVEECKTAQSVPLTRRLPSWAHGTVMTVFPAKWDFKVESLKHLYDGYALLLKMEIEDAKVVLRSKYLESEAYRKACEKQKAVLPEIGTVSSSDSSKSIFSKLTSILPEYSDNGNRHIFKIGKELFVGNGLNSFLQVDTHSLAPGLKFNIRQMFGQELLCANPITDTDGSVYTFCQSFSLKGTNFNITRSQPIPADRGSAKEIQRTLANSKIISSFKTPRQMELSFFQTVGFTKNYIIIVDQPFHADVKGVVAKLIQGGQFSLHDITSFNPKIRNQFLIVEKSSGRKLPLTVESADPFFFFDIINAFETSCGGETKIVMDINTYPTAEVLRETLFLESLRSGNTETEQSTPRVQRFVIPVGSGNEEEHIVLRPTTLVDISIERPTLNRKYFGKQYQYFYGTSLFFQNSIRGSLFKVDTVTRETKVWTGDEDHHIPGHPIYIPKPDATDEDDGILMTVITDARRDGKSFILFLCAKTFEEISRAETDGFLPVVLYGLFEPK